MDRRLALLFLLAAVIIAAILSMQNSGTQPSAPAGQDNQRPGEQQGSPQAQNANGNLSSPNVLTKENQAANQSGGGNEKSGGSSAAASKGPGPSPPECPEFKGLQVLQFSFGYLASNNGSATVDGWEIMGNVPCSPQTYNDENIFFCQLSVRKVDNSSSKQVNELYSADNGSYIATQCP